MREDNGGTTLQCGRDNLDLFAAMLLSLGCRIVVREPPELKDAFAALAERAGDAASASALATPVHSHIGSRTASGNEGAGQKG